LIWFWIGWRCFWSHDALLAWTMGVISSSLSNLKKQAFFSKLGNYYPFVADFCRMLKQLWAQQGTMTSLPNCGLEGLFLGNETKVRSGNNLQNPDHSATIIRAIRSCSSYADLW
jgi:hypothetical protein